MDRVLTGAKILSLLSLCFALTVAGIDLLRVRAAVIGFQDVLTHTSSLIVDADGMVKRANLTLKESDYLILKAGLTADSAKQASDKELVMLDQWNREITETLGDTDATVRGVNSSLSRITVQLGTTMSAVDTTVASIEPVSRNAAVMIDAANQLLRDPNIAKTLSNTAGSTANLNAATADVRQAVHSYLHPTWPHRIWSAITGVGIDIGRILF